MPIEPPRRRESAPSRYAPVPAEAAATTRIAALVIVAAAVATVLAALPYSTFQFDRYTLPKELLLGLAALTASLLCLAAARRLTVFMVDPLLAGFLVVSAISSLLATNRWLAARALGVSLAGAALFWCARAIARAGRGQVLLVGLAAAVVVGALTGLVQAYGIVESDLTSLSRSPGGTFGNRNFMAHLVAIGFPVLLYVSVAARSRTGFGLGAIGLALAAAALVLSRSRAAWLGAGASALFLAVEGFWVGRLWAEERLRRRVLGLAVVGVASLALTLAIPNRLDWRSDSPYLESLRGVANYKEGSGRGRMIQWGNTLAMAARHPLLGVGPGNWPVFYPAYMSKGDPSFDPGDMIPTNPWPSSDWMATASERGFPALLLLSLVGGAIGLGAWARVRRGPRAAPVLTDLTIVATLISVAVVGAFDAVLLLPVPTLFSWTSVGALAAAARPLRELPLTSRARRGVMLAVVLVGAPFVARSAAQTLAMRVFGDGQRASMEAAVAIDPGSYRIRMLLARAWQRAGRCDRALPHATAARELFPNHPAPVDLLRACGAVKQGRRPADPSAVRSLAASHSACRLSRTAPPAGTRLPAVVTS